MSKSNFPPPECLQTSFAKLLVFERQAGEFPLLASTFALEESARTFECASTRNCGSGVLFEKRRGERKQEPAPLESLKWLNTKQAALYLGTSEGQIRNLVQDGRLIRYKPHGRLLFKRTELDAFVEASRNGGFNNGF